MDWDKYLFEEREAPLADLSEARYSRTSVFRTMAFIGDSLSSGEFESRDAEGKPHFHDMFEYSWGQYIARKNGLTAYNFSRGGMTAKEYMDSFAEKKGFWTQELACQAYVIAMGCNDLYGRNMEIGSIADIDPKDYTKNQPTFAGYYAQIISRYKEISPDAKFFFVTLPRTDNPKKEEKAEKMAELLHALADYFDNSYVIDLHQYAPIYDKRFRERFYLYGHLSPEGYIFTAEMIDRYIDYIVRHDYNNFKTVGFIASDRNGGKR